MAPKIVAMLPVRNESGRYLLRVLNHLSGWVDEIVVLDDGSTDDTSRLRLAYPKVVTLARTPENLFATNEGLVRACLWELAVRRTPRWLLAIDADEVFEDAIVQEIDGLTQQEDYHAIEFRLFDFWGGEMHYRVDGGWNPWPRFVRFWVRYDPSRPVVWPQTPIHCGRWPIAYRYGLPAYQSHIRVKHLGWVNPAEHRRKYAFYARWDLELYGSIKPHTASILEPPVLEAWY